MFHPFRKTYHTPGGRVYHLYTELADRPHLLIAGATGSGKSVTVDGIMYSLLARRSPYTAQFILIDPKKVELSRYAKLPHTIEYACEPGDIVQALESAVAETDNRFRSMSHAHVREWTGPDLYVIIDELADLMTTMRKETLPLLQRLAQTG